MAAGESSVPEGSVPAENAPENTPEKTLREAADELALFPVDAFQFVEEGLAYTVNEIHRAVEPSTQDRHISGQQLCEGLRRYALLKWGLLARTVLRRWNITCTFDFGRIVYALIDAGRMSRCERDSIDHFRDVYDFRSAFESAYQIAQKNEPKSEPKR